MNKILNNLLNLLNPLVKYEKTIQKITFWLGWLAFILAFIVIICEIYSNI